MTWQELPEQYKTGKLLPGALYDELNECDKKFFRPVGRVGDTAAAMFGFYFIIKKQLQSRSVLNAGDLTMQEFCDKVDELCGELRSDDSEVILMADEETDAYNYMVTALATLDLPTHNYELEHQFGEVYIVRRI